MSEMEVNNELQGKSSVSAVDDKMEIDEEHPMDSASNKEPAQMAPLKATPSVVSTGQEEKKNVIVIKLTSMNPSPELKNAENIIYAGPEDQKHALQNGDKLVHVLAANSPAVNMMKGSGPVELVHNMHTKDMYAVYLIKRTGSFEVFHVKYSGHFRPTYRYVPVDERVIIFESHNQSE